MQTNIDDLAYSHNKTLDKLFKILNSTHAGLSYYEASSRLKQFGPNIMPEAKSPSPIMFFLRQFKNPLIYILVLAAIFSLFIGEVLDSVFITIVLVSNALIGTSQEYSAHKLAKALSKLVVTTCHVLRDGENYEVKSNELVIGDIIFLESGDKVPADIRLISSSNLEADESLLTGESISVLKDPTKVLNKDTIISDRLNMVHMGSIINSGRATGIVIGTGLNTELGKIASSVLSETLHKPPLIARMEKFTNNIAIAFVSILIILAVVAFVRGMSVVEIFMVTVALAVAAIPEGLPIAITVTLAVSMKRMLKRHVIVRKLVAVESLGSCTYIAVDKTGTLTENKLQVTDLEFPDGSKFNLFNDDILPSNPLINRLCRTAVLANEAVLCSKNGVMGYHGDLVDVSLLVMAHKYGFVRTKLLNDYSELAVIPFESKNRISASLNKINHSSFISVKGAAEKLLPMCNYMATSEKDIPIDKLLIEEQVHNLASLGFRVICFATKELTSTSDDLILRDNLNDLTFIGMVGITNPLRSNAKEAISQCKKAGIKIAMVTGDHPSTALSIAKQLNLATEKQQIVTGSLLAKTNNLQEKIGL